MTRQSTKAARRIRVSRLWLLAFAAAGLALTVVGLGSLARAQAGPADILILETTVSGGLASAEAREAMELGFTVEIASASAWAAKSRAAFESYKAIVLGDPNCSGVGSLAPAEANKAVWSAAVTGNVIINGTDPALHNSQPGAELLTNNSIAFAAAKTGETGLYLSLSCYYASAPAGTPVPVLSEFGAFTVRGQNADDSHIVATHPALSGLTDANLSNWGNSTHEGFVTWPDLTFEVLAINEDIPSDYVAPDGTTGAPYILARGVEVVSDIKLAPEEATNPVGTSHTLTATVTEGGTPTVEETVTFTVIDGPHAETTGTDTTNASGVATFTYTGTEPGTDTIEATFVDSRERTQRSNRVTKTWGGDENPPPPPPPPPAEPPPPPPPPPPQADVNVVITQEVLPASAFGVQLRPAAAAVPPGTRMRYLLTITNNGPAPASNVAVTHTAPAGSSFQSASTDTGSCVGAGPTLTCSLGTLAVGQQAHVQDVAIVGQSGAATTTASVSASEVDPTGANNSASATIDVDAQPPPPPPPPALPGTADGVPNANRTVVVQELAGRVRVRLPGTNRFVELSSLDLRELPNGTLVDATGGRFMLITAAAGGQNDQAEFFEGAATISQRAPAAARSAAGAAAPGVTELGLGLGDFGRPCTTALAKAKPKAKKKAKRQTFGVAQAKPVKPVRRLWGSGGGKFRTRGRFSSATVRGTVWLTEDYCNGTLVRVREGSVTVRDLVKNRTVVVTAGRSYFAEAPAPKAAKAKAKSAKKAKKRSTARTQR